VGSFLVFLFFINIYCFLFPLVRLSTCLFLLLIFILHHRMHKQEKERVSERERQEGVASTYFLLFSVDRRRVRGRLLFFCSWKLREESCCCVQKWTNQRERGVPVSVEKQWRRSASDRKGCTSIYISFNGGDCMDHTHPTAGAATWAASCDETWQIGRAARGVGWPQRRDKATSYAEVLFVLN